MAPAFLAVWRWLTDVFWNMPTCSAPAVMRTASGFQTEASNRTAPQKHSPTYVVVSFSYTSRVMFWVYWGGVSKFRNGTERNTFVKLDPGGDLPLVAGPAGLQDSEKSFRQHLGGNVLRLAVRLDQSHEPEVGGDTDRGGSARAC